MKSVFRYNRLGIHHGRPRTSTLNQKAGEQSLFPGFLVDKKSAFPFPEAPPARCPIKGEKVQKTKIGHMYCV